jgi:hypothetical protein
MNIDINLALTIATCILLAGLIKHIAVVGLNQVFGFGGSRKTSGESGSAYFDGKVSSKG